MRDQYRSIEIIRQVKAPILVMHGTADRVIPYAFGEALFAAAPEPKRFVRFEGAGHTVLLEKGGLAAVEEFLKPIEATIPLPPDTAQSKPQP
jgi:pimeloyl-ACP methyl ester carboxylesterase